MKSAIKQLSEAQRWALHYMARAEQRWREGRGKRTREVYSVGASGDFRTPTMRKLVSIGYLREFEKARLGKRWALTPRGRRLGLQIEAWMCGIGDEPGTPYEIKVADEHGNRFELLANAHHPTLFVTVARHDDDEDADRVFEIECDEFFEKVHELRRMLPQRDDSRPWITKARAEKAKAS